MQKERLSNIVKKYRRDYGFTQQNLSDMSGLSVAYISIIERAEDPKTHLPPAPTLETYEKLAKAMNMTRDELISRVEGRQMFEKIVFQNSPAYAVPIIKKIHGEYSVEEILRQTTDVLTVSDNAYKKNKTVAFRIEEDTLSPEIQKNDMAIIWLDEIFSDGDFVLAIQSENGNLLCYKVCIDNDITILYGNLQTKPIMVDELSSIKIIGKIVFVQKQL